MLISTILPAKTLIPQALSKDGEDDLYVEVYKTHYPENPQQECYAVEVYDENSSFIDTIFSENLSLGSLCETLSQL